MITSPAPDFVDIHSCSCCGKEHKQLQVHTDAAVVFGGKKFSGYVICPTTNERVFVSYERN